MRISDKGRPQDLSEQIYKNISEMTILVTQLVVEFAKQLPGFTSLNREDQIVLLKVRHHDVTMTSIAASHIHSIQTVCVLFRRVPLLK